MTRRKPEAEIVREVEYEMYLDEVGHFEPTEAELEDMIFQAERVYEDDLESWACGDWSSIIPVRN